MKTSHLLSVIATASLAANLLLTTAFAQTVVSYTSPIANYQTFADEKVSSWKAANDKVGQIGGWRAYAKEANQPDNTPALTPSAAPMKKSMVEDDAMKKNPHAGHKP